MSRLESKLFALAAALAWLPAFAIDAADAPAETASPMVVAGFFVLLLGGCAGYVGYLIWSAKKKRDD